MRLFNTVFKLLIAERSKLSDELAISRCRTYVRHIGRVWRRVRGLSAGGTRRPRWLSPPLLYFICFAATAGAAEVTEAGMRGDIFHRARVPSTVISTKIRQRLAIVPVSAVLSRRLPHIVRQFFSPRHTAGQRTATRVTIFMLWSRRDKVRPVDSAIDERPGAGGEKKIQSRRRPKGHRRDIPPRS